ncbi:MAG: peptidoglycan-binding domain-containing protein, partial [Polyangiaceae bacterium]
MKATTSKVILFTVLLLVFGGAAACSDSGGASAPSDHALASSGDLTLNSHGDAVAALTQSLTAFGYFPNTELALEFPAWRPVVPVAPADAAIFDEHTAQAVREFQGRNGLTATGVVDQATQTLLLQPRCGNPDSARFDSADKFAVAADLGTNGGCGHGPSTWASSSVNYFVTQAPPGVATHPNTAPGLAAAQAAADAAAGIWNAAANAAGATPGTIYLNKSPSPTQIDIY